MNSVHFNVINWLALSPGLTDSSAWTTWSNDKQWPEHCDAVPATLIPAMMRRRMSSLSKLAMQAAMSLVNTHDTQVDYIVFASRHGELTRTVKLMHDILTGEDASPTAFSQSVHNTASGLYTIATKQAIPVTSLGACENTLHAALIEVAAYLVEHPSHTVLLVDFDEPLPAPYQRFDAPNYQGYAFGMLLTGGNDVELAWEPQLSSHGSSNTDRALIEASKQAFPQSLDVLAHWVKSGSSWTIDSARARWHWKRK